MNDERGGAWLERALILERPFVSPQVSHACASKSLVHSPLDSRASHAQGFLLFSKISLKALESMLRMQSQRHR
jgi:hypothetical protein